MVADYQAILKTGFITNKTTAKIIEFLGRVGASTTQEIADGLRRQRDHVSPTLPHLQRAGLVRIKELRAVGVLGRTNKVWELTGAIPTKPFTRKAARRFYIVGTHAFKKKENAIACSVEVGQPVIPTCEIFTEEFK